MPMRTRGQALTSIGCWFLFLGAGPCILGQQPQAVLLPPVDKVQPQLVPIDVPRQQNTPLTLASLESLALNHNPTIPQAQSLVQQQQGLTKQVGLYPNPALGYLRADPDQPGQSQSQGVFFSQELVTAGKLSLARAAGREEIAFSNWQLQAQQARVLNDVRIRYFEVLGAQRAIKAAEELEALALDGVQAAEKLLKAQQGTRPDVLQAEIQLGTVRTALQDARVRFASAWRQLVNVIGLPEMPPTMVAGNLEDDVPQLDWQESLQELLASSPLLQAQLAQIREAELEVKLARAQAVPNMNVQVVAERDHVQKFTTVSTLVSMPVVVFNRNQGNIVKAQGNLVQQTKEYERIRLALADQLAVSFRQYLSLRNQADTLHKDILPRAKESLDLTTQGYKAGRIDFLRVLHARQTYFQANLAYIEALTELAKVGTEIKGLQLTGGLNPTEVGTALQSTAAAGTTSVRALLQQLQEQRNGTSRNLPGVIQGGADR